MIVPSGPSLLIIDDSRAVRRIIRAQLEERELFTAYYEAANGEEGLELVAKHRPDMVLCDLDMPVLDGFGFLRRFRETDRSTFVLMLSGSGESRTKVEGFALGANDYIVKPCDPAELCARVSNYIRLKQLQSELEQKNSELERKNRDLVRLATTDALTGLHNRRHFLATVQAELDELRAAPQPGSVLMIDIDHFKRINDILGHAQGDAALVAVSSTVRDALRAEDVLARFGGEEFVVWMPRTNETEGLSLAEHVRAAVAARVVPGMPWNVSVSIGISTVDVAVGAALDTILASADAALYRAKNDGRNRVVSAGAHTSMIHVAA